MIVHLFPKSQFTQAYVQFVNKKFEYQKHLFVLYTNKKFELPDEVYQNSNVVDYDYKGLFWFWKVLRKADKIIFHTIAVNIKELFLLYINNCWMRKAVWLIWGADLYCYKDPRTKVMDKFVEVMRKKIISKMSTIATLVEGDYTLVQKWYHVNTNHIRLNYCNEAEIKLLEALRNQPNSDKKEINILLGNSATQTNMHIEILERLRPLSQANIKIYTPLSYGDRQYANVVEENGNKYFGDHFVPIKQFMELRQYLELLNEMDVAIFNNNRQQALGNIFALLYLGKKVYMRPGTSMWDELVNTQGFLIHSTDELVNDIGKISDLDDYERGHNCQCAGNYFDVEQRVKEWNKAFNI